MVQPNKFQTWPQFLYRSAMILYARNTCFIVPVLNDYGETTGIISILPRSWELVEDHGMVYVRFTFDNGKRRAVELNSLGILTRYQLNNDLFGEDNSALKPTLDLIEMQRQGISEGIKNSATYRFMATSSNWATDEDLAKERERFNEHNFRSGSGGVLLWPNTYKDIKQIQQDAYKVDPEQMNTIKNNVFSYFAVNEEIIQNKAFGDSWMAFYEGAVEWFAVQCSETLTRMLYTERERTAYGNRLWLTANRLQYMSNSDKLSAISQLADRGLMTRNELRDILNLSPLPEPYGSQIPARGEYYNVAGVQEGGNNDAE